MEQATFRLNETFLSRYKEQQPKFGFNGLGELVYRRTYSRIKEDGTNEVWWETVRRVVEGCYRMQERHIHANGLGWDPRRAKRSAEEMYDRIFTFKFLPPGRGLWAMGSELTEERGIFAALNNCFSGDTEFLTDRGAVKFSDVVGQEVHVLNGRREYSPALVREFGVQTLQEVVLRPKGMRTNHRLRYKVTPDHAWVMADGERTTELSVGDTVRSQTLASVMGEQFTWADQGLVHGLIFGDGTRHTYYSDRFMIRLCGDKSRHLGTLEQQPGYVSTRLVEGDPFVTLRSMVDLKALPVQPSPAYVLGFITGWIRTDGHENPSGGFTVDTQNAKAAEWLVSHAPQAGYTVTGHSIENNPTNFGERSAPLHRISLAAGDKEFIVESITPLVEAAPVYCVTEPETHAFTLAGGILTGNCGFRTTQYLAVHGVKPFTFVMDASMLGIGVGFDVLGAGKLTIRKPKANFGGWLVMVIPDSREGWVDSVEAILKGYFYGEVIPVFDFSQIRPAGTPIKGFGGVASGPDDLKQLHQSLTDILKANVGQPITVTTIADIMNLIGKCVVAGNVRRTALINFGDPNDDEYLGLKHYWWDTEQGKYVGPNAYRSGWAWTSNNSVFCPVGMDYAGVAERTAVNGEPGYAWLSNMQNYGRMIDRPDYRDHRVMGGNPCLEQSLEDAELCCLVETYPNNHTDLADYTRTLKMAYLYAKTVTLGKTHWPETNRVMLRNRRIGTSMSGVQQFIAERGIDTLREWCELGYEELETFDRIYSDWFAVPLSIKKTSIKPSGTVSLLAGATPGMHWPESLHYIRRVRLGIFSELVQPLKAAGYPVEPAVGSEDSTLVVEIPVKLEDYGGKLRTLKDVSMWEQMAMASFLQRYWADNQVSATVTFDPETEGHQIAHALNYHQYSLKGVSLLPREENKYPQMPYEAISAEEYERRVGLLKPLQFHTVHGEEAEIERFCDGEGCLVS